MAASVPAPDAPASPKTSDTQQGMRAIMALLAGFVVGAVAQAVNPELASPLLRVAEPVGALWVNAIRMTVIPLVVSLMFTGVAQGTGTGDVARLGGRAVAIFAILLSAVALVTAVAAPSIFQLLHVDPASAAALRASVEPSATTVPPLPTFTSWLTGLVPTNPVKAAADGTMLPLIVFAAAFALAARGLAERERQALIAFFRAVGDAMLVLVRWVLALAPVGIGALAIALGARLGVAAVGAVAFYLMAHIALLIVALALLYAVVAGSRRVPLSRFARSAMPAQVVAMSTRSSLAAIPAMLDAAEARLGVSRSTSAFVVPFAVAIFRLNVAVSWIVGGLFLSRLYDLPFGISAVGTFAVAAAVMSFSVPGIPSGSLFIIAPLLPTVGLPVEGVGILIALDALPDVFKTMLNVTGHMTSVVLLSDRVPASAAGDSAPREAPV